MYLKNIFFLPFLLYLKELIEESYFNKLQAKSTLLKLSLQLSGMTTVFKIIKYKKLINI